MADHEPLDDDGKMTRSSNCNSGRDSWRDDSGDAVKTPYAASKDKAENVAGIKQPRCRVGCPDEEDEVKRGFRQPDEEDQGVECLRLQDAPLAEIAVFTTPCEAIEDDEGSDDVSRSHDKVIGADTGCEGAHKGQDQCREQRSTNTSNEPKLATHCACWGAAIDD